MEHPTKWKVSDYSKSLLPTDSLAMWFLFTSSCEKLKLKKKKAKKKHNNHKRIKLKTKKFIRGRDVSFCKNYYKSLFDLFFVQMFLYSHVRRNKCTETEISLESISVFLLIVLNVIQHYYLNKKKNLSKSKTTKECLKI